MANRGLSIASLALGVVMLVAGLFAGFQTAKAFNEPESFCRGGANLGTIDGYTWKPDMNNGCSWTLWDANGEAAAPEVYADLTIPYPGPTPKPFNLSTALLVVGALWLTASGVLIMTGVNGLRRPAAETDDHYALV
ncbi:MAG: hypothetical protein GWP18_05165 [Proteobacteria bacterium]|nr:hypothetical protein [Pseudomonadota bacterium]